MAEKKDETQKVQLLCSWASPFSLRIEIALALKGIEYEKLPQDLSEKSPLLLASNPMYKKIPVLLHGDRIVCESSIIVQYIDEAFHDHHRHRFLPEDAYGRATARFWADFMDKKVLDAVIRVVKTQGEAQKAAMEDAMACFETLDDALGKVSGGGGSPFFGGHNMGLVDIMFSPLVCWFPAIEEASAGGLKFAFHEKYPRLHAWLLAFKQSPVVAHLLPDPEKITEFAINVIRKSVM